MTIRHYHETSPLNIAVMTTEQWYKVMLEDQVLKIPTNENTPSTCITIRVEELSPQTDWKATWSIARAKGLDSELTAFIFKLLHCLLPTQDRVSRIVRKQNLNTGLCPLCHAEVEEPQHAFYSCPYSSMLDWHYFATFN